MSTFGSIYMIYFHYYFHFHFKHINLLKQTQLFFLCTFFILVQSSTPGSGLLNFCQLVLIKVLLIKKRVMKRTDGNTL